MDKQKLKELLDQYKDEKITVDKMAEMLTSHNYTEMKDVCVDNMRGLRVGFPEVIYGAGKTAEQIIAAIEKMRPSNSIILVTRVEGDVAESVKRAHPDCKENKKARTLTLGQIKEVKGKVCVVCAGTSDLYCAEEAAETVTAMGIHVERVYDVGVAGLHRLLDRVEVLRGADALVVVAGMEGALPSVVSGLVDVPTIAVPTSIGYGASFNGLAALLAMLNSCASGISVVNIDNGFGGGYQAALIAKRASGKV